MRTVSRVRAKHGRSPSGSSTRSAASRSRVFTCAFELGRFEGHLVVAQRRELDAVARDRDSLAGRDRTPGTTLDRWGTTVAQGGGGDRVRQPPRDP